METSETVNNPEPSGSELDQIESLLRGEPEVDVDANGYETEQPEKAQEDPEPERELVDGEEVEVEAEEPQIDYELEVPMPDGREAMKLGELKDKVVEIERTKSELDRVRAEILEEKQLMTHVMSQMGEIPPEVQQQMQQRHQQYLKGQHQAMLQAIPEWQDNSAFEADRPRILEAGKHLGFNEAELGTITDARLVLALKRLADYEAREAKAPEKVQKKAAPKPQRKPYKPKDNDAELVKQAKDKGSLVDQIGDIEQLLRSN